MEARKKRGFWMIAKSFVYLIIVAGALTLVATGQVALAIVVLFAALVVDAGHAFLRGILLLRDDHMLHPDTYTFGSGKLTGLSDSQAHLMQGARRARRG